MTIPHRNSPRDVCDVRVVDADRVAATRSRMPEPAEIDAAVELFKALGDGTRAQILYALHEAGELCVCDLAATVEAPESTVSHALRWLRGAGVVGARRSGRMMYYRLDEDHLDTLLRLGRDHRHHGEARR